MMELKSSKIPTWFWIVAGLALVWNLLGAFAYIGQMTTTAEALAALPPAERALYENYPSWAAAAFAIAVFGGTLGCILLLLKKKLATPVFTASFIGVAVQMIHSFFIANSIAVYGPGAAAMPAMIVIIAGALIWHAKRSTSLGWLR